MKKYRVYGQYTATISKEVWAEDEYEARELAAETFCGVDTYINNTIGVDGEDEDIEADGEPVWDHPFTTVEVVEENEEMVKCPECDNCTDEIYGEYEDKLIWYCDECGTYFDEDKNIYDEDELNKEDE